jgi:hypothetical protein
VDLPILNQSFLRRIPTIAISDHFKYKGKVCEKANKEKQSIITFSESKKN